MSRTAGNTHGVSHKLAKSVQADRGRTGFSAGGVQHNQCSGVPYGAAFKVTGCGHEVREQTALRGVFGRAVGVEKRMLSRIKGGHPYGRPSVTGQDTCLAAAKSAATRRAQNVCPADTSYRALHRALHVFRPGSATKPGIFAKVGARFARPGRKSTKPGLQTGRREWRGVIREHSVRCTADLGSKKRRPGSDLCTEKHC